MKLDKLESSMYRCFGRTPIFLFLSFFLYLKLFMQMLSHPAYICSGTTFLPSCESMHEFAILRWYETSCCSFFFKSHFMILSLCVTCFDKEILRENCSTGRAEIISRSQENFRAVRQWSSYLLFIYYILTHHHR